MATNHRLALYFCLAFGLLCQSQANAQSKNLSEYDLKIVYLYNFTKFVRWPNSSFSAPQSNFNICIKGELPPQAAIKHLQQKSTRGHPLRIIPVDKLKMATDCHIVYFRDHDPTGEQALTESLKNAPVLTVSDQKDFALTKGVVEFSIDSKQRIHLKINHKRAKTCGISISAQLLEIASVITQVEQI